MRREQLTPEASWRYAHLSWPLAPEWKRAFFKREVGIARLGQIGG